MQMFLPDSIGQLTVSAELAVVLDGLCCSSSPYQCNRKVQFTTTVKNSFNLPMKPKAGSTMWFLLSGWHFSYRIEYILPLTKFQTVPLYAMLQETWEQAQDKDLDCHQHKPQKSMVWHVTRKGNKLFAAHNFHDNHAKRKCTWYSQLTKCLDLHH